MASATAKAAAIAGQMGQPLSVVRIAMVMPLAPMIEPMERSNSPPIMSSATATARMPSSALTSR